MKTFEQMMGIIAPRGEQHIQIPRLRLVIYMLFLGFIWWFVGFFFRGAYIIWSIFAFIGGVAWTVFVYKFWRCYYSRIVFGIVGVIQFAIGVLTFLLVNNFV